MLDVYANITTCLPLWPVFVFAKILDAPTYDTNGNYNDYTNYF